MPLSKSISMGLKIYFKTIPFLFLRMLVTLLLGVLIALGFGLAVLIFFSNIFPENVWIKIVTAIFIPIYLIAVIKVVYRYLMFMIFSAHIAAMSMFFKGINIGFLEQISYGFNIVKQKIISLSFLWIARQIAYAIFRALTGLVRFVTGWIPGVRTIVRIILAILDRFILIVLDVVTTSMVVENYDPWMNAKIGMIVVKRNWKNFLYIAIIFLLSTYLITFGTFFGITYISGYMFTGPISPLPIIIGVISAAIIYYAFLIPYIQAVMVCEYMYNRMNIPENTLYQEAYALEQEIASVVPYKLRMKLSRALSEITPPSPY